LLAARLGQRPQVGRVALLNALVKAYKPYHHRAGRKSGSFFVFIFNFSRPIFDQCPADTEEFPVAWALKNV